MTAASILGEINKLPLADKLLIIEKTLKAIRHEKEHDLDQAVGTLYSDYKTEKELTVFTLLDSEPFYEAR